jgi:hypothetical protein
MPFCSTCGSSVSPEAVFCPHCGARLSGASRATVPAPSSAQYYELDPDASTARTLTLIALIIQGIFFFIGLAVSSVAFATLGFARVPIGVGGIFAAVFGLGFLISIVWIGLDYFLVYKNLSSTATVANARTPSIVLGIIQLIFGGVIAGILLIVAYLKICDSMRRRGQIY